MTSITLRAPTFVNLLLLLVQLAFVYCQSSISLVDPTISVHSDKLENVSIITTTTTTITTTTPIPTTTLATSEALLSGNEFVDFTEAPIILYDGTSNEEESNDTSYNPTSSLKMPNLDMVTTIEPSENATSTGTTEASSVTNIMDEIVVDGEEEATDEETQDEPKEEADQQSFEPPQNVSQYMDYIERLFHDFRHQITDLFEPHIPQLIRTSQMVQLSGSCSYDMLRMALALRQFEPWALRMIDSSGKVPEGIFEGSFTALGSYDECLNTAFPSSTTATIPGSSTVSSAGISSQGNAPFTTQGKYCLVNVSPFLPPKPPADRVELMFQEEANRRNYTKDDQFSRLSPMFYYMKFRIGLCIPSTCLDSDMDSISSALSSSLRLNITIPHCRVKQSQPITGHQLAGGIIFGLVLVTVIGATLMDYSGKKLDRMKRQDGIVALSVASVAVNEKQGTLATGIQTPVILSTRKGILTTATSTIKGQNFIKRLDKHWSWMSFSLLTNYKIYFRHKRPTDITNTTINNNNHHRQRPLLGRSNLMIIRCLNGIRVISLCWVIMANSYITLDPRATKRLTKTREAPRDFLFQMVAQASLAIETFFFLSGILMSLSFARKLNPERRTKPEEEDNQSGHKEKSYSTQRKSTSYALQWIHFYVHRYMRMTPATMLVIAFTMFAFRYGDGPLWFESTNKAHLSCSENWWRHLLHVANFIDTRQMCFIHYWYIAADMQLFLFAPLLLFLLYQRRRVGYAIATLIGLISIGFVFYTTYIKNLPPTLLFYNSDPESRREFGNTIMTKPLTHALPYMVGMLVGKWLITHQVSHSIERKPSQRSMMPTIFGFAATTVALSEVFLPYKWNNSHLPTRFLASLYAALFRFSWSLALAYLVISCRHKRDKRCCNEEGKGAFINETQRGLVSNCNSGACCKQPHHHGSSSIPMEKWKVLSSKIEEEQLNGASSPDDNHASGLEESMCVCGSGGSALNRLLSLNIFTHLSKLSFVAYLIHLPLMSVFIAQTRGLFAFSHMLVIHLALSYLVMTFILSFVLVHIIEFPFITFERYLFEKLFYSREKEAQWNGSPKNQTNEPMSRNSNEYGMNKTTQANYCLQSGENYNISERL